MHTHCSCCKYRGLERFGIKIFCTQRGKESKGKKEGCYGYYSLQLYSVYLFRTAIIMVAIFPYMNCADGALLNDTKVPFTKCNRADGSVKIQMRSQWELYVILIVILTSCKPILCSFAFFASLRESSQRPSKYSFSKPYSASILTLCF